MKYDFKKEKFHFTENPDFKRKNAPVEKKPNNTVTFNDVEFKDGKVIVKEVLNVTN